MGEIRGLPAGPTPSALKAEPAELSPDIGRRAELATLAVVQRIQPTALSEWRRAAVVDYVQRLIRWRVGCEVFPFGSVPLKTYLPDGDIDLTAFGFPNSEDRLANEVHAVLESEERNKDAEFEVKDVQYINAEVKLVKCLVQNIVVDISFNQIGGLCTLCFLEKVDQEIGKDHLFKRSIMLIKAWCYYESRILGAHHGLISTYALETLVLYIFHLFHKCLDGPLAVLYRFLDYYSKFDWDKYGVSLCGPVTLSCLPELFVEPTETQDDDLLLSEELLGECSEMFVALPRAAEKSRVFSRKYLNIVDPLKKGNNLGRSVSKGNFYRIRSAFVLGARKLGRILQLPANSVADEVNLFFRSTLKRHGSGERPDVQDALVNSADGLMIDNASIDPGSVSLNVEKASRGSSLLLPSYSNSHGDLSDQFNNMSISNSSNHGMLKQKEWNPLAEHKEALSASGRWPTGNATSLASTRLTCTRNRNDFPQALPSTSEPFPLPSGEAYYAPHLFYQSENGVKGGVKDDTNSSFAGNGLTTSSLNVFPPEDSNIVGYSLMPKEEVGGNGVLGKEMNGGGSSKDNLPDLTGDYNTNVSNLLYAKGFHQDYPMNQFYYQIPSPPPAQYQNKHSWNSYNRKNMYRCTGTNEMVPGPHYPPGYFMVRPLYQADDSARARGTGTYFPNLNLRKDKVASGRGERGKNHLSPSNYQRYQNSGRAYMPTNIMPLEEYRQEPPMQIYSPRASDHGITSAMKKSSPSFHAPREIVHGNGFMHPQDSKLEFGTLGSLPLEVPTQDHASGSDSASQSQLSGPAAPMSPAEKPETGSNQRRNTQPYHLRDDDFPPLSS